MQLLLHRLFRVGLRIDDAVQFAWQLLELVDASRNARQQLAHRRLLFVRLCLILLPSARRPFIRYVGIDYGVRILLAASNR